MVLPPVPALVFVSCLNSTRVGIRVLLLGLIGHQQPGTPGRGLTLPEQVADGVFKASAFKNPFLSQEFWMASLHTQRSASAA